MRVPNSNRLPTIVGVPIVLALIALVLVLAARGDLSSWAKGIPLRPAAAWRQIANLFAFVAFLGVVIAVGGVARQEIDSDNRFLAAMVASAARQ